MPKFRPTIPDCDGPLIESAGALYAWAEKAVPGARCVYQIGQWCGMGNGAARARMLEAQRQVVLFQRRISRLEFAYIAERATPRTIQALNASSLAVSEVATCA